VAREKGPRLTPRRQRFVEEYLANGGNALQAAKAAGYAHPDPEGARLLGNARIRDAIKALTKPDHDRRIATAEERRRFWSAVLRGEGTDGYGNPPKWADRLKASELLGKSSGDFIDRVDATTRIIVEHVYEGSSG
jgi:phage terminase small subunit